MIDINPSSEDAGAVARVVPYAPQCFDKCDRPVTMIHIPTGYVFCGEDADINGAVGSPAWMPWSVDMLTYREPKE